MAEFTKLRIIKTDTSEELLQFVETLPFKIEVKHGPAPLTDGGGWFVSFTIRDQDDFPTQLDLRKSNGSR